MILGACPAARVVDLTHEVPPLDIRAGSFLLWASTRTFPAGTIHVAIVDPGVGTSRRALVVAAAGCLWVAPDNGILDRVLATSAEYRAWELTRTEAASPTFEGRDVFAPAAARLALGDEPGSLGRPAVHVERLPPAGDAVLWVDTFGNLVTSLTADRLDRAVPRIGGQRIEARARTYGEAEPGRLFWYEGSLGLVEIGVASGRADALLDAGAGTAVEVDVAG